ncbi:MAG: hypothetical protein HS114_01440 [Anaerolineales bacterium]|nr:hypothetical protein [Anaerolineales bacterium]
MPIEVIAALIALAGVVISVATSLYISLRQTNTELEKLRSEIHKAYADKVIDKRLETYPQFSCMISDFIKKMELGTITKKDMVEFYHQTNEYDSKLSLLFSGKTGIVGYDLRQTLRKLATMADEEFQKNFDDPKAVKEIRRKIEEFELALKSDLGIYVVEFSDIGKRFKSYKDIYHSVTE